MDAATIILDGARVVAQANLRDMKVTSDNPNAAVMARLIMTGYLCGARGIVKTQIACDGDEFCAPYNLVKAIDEAARRMDLVLASVEK